MLSSNEESFDFGVLQREMLYRSEVVEPWQSYWYHRPLRSFPPPSVRYPAEYVGSDRLALSCTQTDLPSRKQRELVQEWCEILPSLTEVRTLWFQTKVTQELFDAACKMENLDGLYIKWGSIQSLESISGLSKLRRLHIGGAPSAEPIHALSQLTSLVDLELSNVKSAGDLSFLEPMVQLRSLDVSGDGNGSKQLHIETLSPIRVLVNLEKLGLASVKVANESLEPIGELPRLKYLQLSNKFCMDELAKLAGKLPSVKCDRFKPISEPVSWMKCPKCDGETMLLLTGKGKPWLCSVCDADRIEKHVAAFHEITRKAATEAL